MSPTRVYRAAMVTVLVAIGCADEPINPLVPTVGDSDVPIDLAFVLPEISTETIAHARIEEVDPSSGPAGAFSEDPDPTAEEPDMDEIGRIYGAGTTVGFTTTYAYATGRHSYTGNVGRVDTKAVVTVDGQVLGTQPAMRQNAVPFLLDWGEVKSIWAEAYVFTDTDCGLRVSGDSDHRAWFQWFLGNSAPSWGEARVSSQAFPPVEQPDCTEVVEEPYSGESDAGSDGDSKATSCWYLVTYDLETGEIIDAEFLYCDDVIGG